MVTRDASSQGGLAGWAPRPGRSRRCGRQEAGLQLSLGPCSATHTRARLLCLRWPPHAVPLSWLPLEESSDVAARLKPFYFSFGKTRPVGLVASLPAQCKQCLATEVNGGSTKLLGSTHRARRTAAAPVWKTRLMKTDVQVHHRKTEKVMPTMAACDSLIMGMFGNVMTRWRSTLRPHTHILLFIAVVSLIARKTTAFSFRTAEPPSRSSTLFSSSEMAPASFQDQLSKSNVNLDEFIDAAAASTQQSCELLGTKSVGVDYGLVRTGVAQTIGYEPQPITILSDLNATQVCQQIIQYCISEQAKQIIVGLPLHKNGTEAPQSSITREFASDLACLVLARLGPNIPVYLWDERYTSKEAAARVLNKNPNQNLYKTLDADAACIILENYYLENGKGAERVQGPKDMQELCLGAWQLQQQEDVRRKLEESDQRSISRSERRQETMERARKMEETMARDGTLGSTRKKKKKKKRK